MTSRPPSRPSSAAETAAEPEARLKRDAGTDLLNPAPSPDPAAAAPVIETPGTDLARQVAAYDPRADVALIEAAYNLAATAHASQARENGDPYITHPLAVARILAGYRLDTATIATALLHDTVEDTGISLPELEKRFGSDIARLVDGVTKLTRLELQSERTKQAENFRKLVLAMSEDIRVLLVKLADRLHNMRTLHFKPQPEKRARIARETMEIYAPLAERIGMDAVKTELQSLSFRELQPDAYQTITARLAFLRGQGADLIDEIAADLRAKLEAAEVPVIEVNGREKSPYSIWMKMHEKKVEFEQLSDIMAFRIVTTDKANCYAALGAIHSAYRVVPGRFKDYISTPKPNGYQSLHTGVTVPERRNAKIEVQIRTPDMHEIAEYGVAAHWMYKQGGAPEDSPKKRRYPWVRELLEILETAAEPQDFLEHTKLALHQDQVFCFTPKGDLIALPRGATPVDFAYQVHSQVGDACVGAKINGRIVPLRHQLENGDQVEIITARGGTPNPAWERFVVTGKAKARIKRFAMARQRAEYQEQGRSAIARAFRQEGVDFSEKLVEPALKVFKYPGFEELCVAVGAGHITGREVLHAAIPELRGPPRPLDNLPLARARGKPGATVVRTERRREASSGITGLVAGMAVQFAGCCHPVPGDRIVGIVTTGKGVTVHRADCHNLEALAATPERFLDIDWDYEAGSSGAHLGRLDVVTSNEDAAIAAMTVAIAKQNGRLHNLRFAHRGADFAEVVVDLEVSDLRHLSNVVAALRACPGIIQVERSKG
ncbi:bifunctional (p)ppGpp synthetase/guanosine-3',5'-bis(diphosphate) 3'-pyrophosphohydrolase [Roseomonas sp. M0104]|uniref:GTP pyrophosphokinase rsh n=1 Tax=Teichococcus coralli TaxID=2545983 RepID=A0A845B2V9_9PROT|nr:bifunctional (p)ppGpp synthetase/guanosine-3',5'-bis(diphosphate) 3'-pyrophosphohydrolase [Pseudoroseomonas coralli]MXP61993.1 bifunctional (p)ppGpp synthetase/guanosine-3',5'-bis(diphosphate) 3'-pyrophosphohydrolase [Pseudoroseomonas coralli]